MSKLLALAVGATAIVQFIATEPFRSSLAEAVGPAWALTAAAMEVRAIRDFIVNFMRVFLNLS
jgi:hypothetical protein